MKKPLLLFVFVLCATMLFAQKKPFEGTMILKQTTYFHQGKVPQMTDVQVIRMKGQKSVLRNSKGEVVITDYSTPGKVVTTTATKASSGAYVALRLTVPLDMAMEEPFKRLAESQTEATTTKFNYEWETRQIKDQRLELEGDFNKGYFQPMGTIEYPIASKMSFTVYTSGAPLATTSTELLEFTPKPIGDEGFNLPEGVIICNSVTEFTKCLKRETMKGRLVESAKGKTSAKEMMKAFTTAAAKSVPVAETANANTGAQFIESVTANPVVPESLWEF